ncbi:zinc-dependent metalloprotease [Winogradskyella tangerina]|uniref:zinc-dependent metalloprotease n=1 Tax=Winogradskyella tangerina TaxID=2023240 RepID=UPI000DBE47AB|nr:zinc-dependent metalloprotease [Winogradskyella tangerina]
MKNFTFLLVMLFCISFSSSNAQQCGFDSQRAKLQQDPNYLQLEQENEARIQSIIQNSDASRMNGTVITIPVVIHVLHLGEAVGVGSNISDAQIQSSIDNLNDFYRGLTPNSPVDFEIEFALAQRDPNCNATTGINRIDASGLAGYANYGVNVLNSNGASYNDIVGLSSWPQTEYFNIWIVTELDNNNGGFGFQGYAYFYSEVSSTHGSVMMSTVFGYDPGNTNGWGLNSNGDNSTVVHEVGHYFNLYHTFQGDDTNNDGVSDACPADTTVGNNSDGCADTVPHQRETSTCPSNNTCTGSAWVDNNTIYNVMSYYHCTDRLTNDQRTRARAAMDGTLIANSKGDEAPLAGFTAPNSVCSTNSPTGNNFSGIMSVELNGTSIGSSTTGIDGGNLDRSQDCSGLFEIDADGTNTVNVTVAPGNFHQVGLWIDWNNDGDFNDDAEQQGLNDDIVGGATTGITITNPSTVPYDSFVRMRLITDVDDRFSGVNLINSACYSSLVYGQSEDYVVYVEPATLSIEDNALNNLSIYSSTNPKEIVVKGQLLGDTALSLYDIQGRNILNHNLDQDFTTHTVDVSSFSSGVYIVRLEYNSQIISKKLIIN